MKSNIMGLEDQTPRLEGWTRATEEETLAQAIARPVHWRSLSIQDLMRDIEKELKESRLVPTTEGDK